MSDRLKENILSPHHWMRILYMAFFAVVCWLLGIILTVLVVGQALFSLLSGRDNANLRQLGGSLSLYFFQILLFLTYKSEEKPFPFAPFPETGAAPPSPPPGSFGPRGGSARFDPSGPAPQPAPTGPAAGATARQAGAQAAHTPGMAGVATASGGAEASIAPAAAQVSAVTPHPDSHANPAAPAHRGQSSAERLEDLPIPEAPVMHPEAGPVPDSPASEGLAGHGAQEGSPGQGEQASAPGAATNQPAYRPEELPPVSLDTRDVEDNDPRHRRDN